MTPVGHAGGLDRDRLAARARHPSTRNPVPAGAVRQRLTTRLRSAGVEHADVAAALLQARGLEGSDQQRFAVQVGVDVVALRRAEGGELALHELPAPLRDVIGRLVVTG